MMDCPFVFADFCLLPLQLLGVLQRALTQSLSVVVVEMHAQPHLHPVINNPLAFPASTQPQIFSIYEKCKSLLFSRSRSPPVLVFASPQQLRSRATTVHNDPCCYQEHKRLLNGFSGFTLRAQGQCWCRDSTISVPVR